MQHAHLLTKDAEYPRALSLQVPVDRLVEVLVEKIVEVPVPYEVVKEIPVEKVVTKQDDEMVRRLQVLREREENTVRAGEMVWCNHASANNGMKGENDAGLACGYDGRGRRKSRSFKGTWITTARRKSRSFKGSWIRKRIASNFTSFTLGENSVSGPRTHDAQTPRCKISANVFPIFCPSRLSVAASLSHA
jgi:hypothetical protein